MLCWYLEEEHSGSKSKGPEARLCLACQGQRQGQGTARDWSSS